MGWQQKSYDVSGAGSHTLKWVYVKDESDDENDDCGRLDWVLWTGAPDPTPDPPPDPTKWKTIDYTYDPAGRRIKKTIDDDYKLKYIYDGGNVIAEYDHDNFLLRKYIYGPGVDEPICMIDAVDNDAEYYYHYDGLGSVVALSDSTGDTVQTYEYSIYGQVAASDPNFLTNPYLFTGRRFDIETGLYYYRARYYNPYIGRFMQTDPVGYADGINWYLYCGNNPLSFVDPSGLVAIAFWDHHFEEYADDFGEYVYEMNSFGDVIKMLQDLHNKGVEVTEVYFYDHAEGPEEPWEEIDTLQFGRDRYHFDDGKGPMGLFAHFREIGWLAEDATLHFRHCFVGNPINHDRLKALARWTNGDVTGPVNLVEAIKWDANSKTLENNYTDPETGDILLDLPDYYSKGGYVRAFQDEHGVIQTEKYIRIFSEEEKKIIQNSFVPPWPW